MVMMTVIMIKQYAIVTRLSLSSKLGGGGGETVLPLLGVGVVGGGGEGVDDRFCVCWYCVFSCRLFLLDCEMYAPRAYLRKGALKPRYYY